MPRSPQGNSLQDQFLSVPWHRKPRWGEHGGFSSQPAADRSVRCCQRAARRGGEPARPRLSPSEHAIPHSGTKHAGARTGRRSWRLTGRVTSCRADVPLGSSYSRAVVYHFAFSALAKKDAPLLHSVTQKRLNLHVVMFSNRHQQTSPVGNRALYWQFISALNTSHSE